MFETFVLNFSFFLSPASFSSSIIAFLRSRHVSDRGRRDAESFERVSHWIPFEMRLAVFRAVFRVRLLFSQDPFAQLPLRSLLIGGRSDMPKRSTWRRIFFCRRFIGFLKLRASPSASRWLVSRVQSRLPALAKRRILLRRALAGICPPLCSRDELLASPGFLHFSHRSEHKEYDEYHHMNFSVKMTATFIEIIFDGEYFLKFLVKLPLHGEN